MEIPAKIAIKFVSLRNNLNMKKMLNDQNNSKGVSVDIIKLPRDAAGVKIHIKAANFPALAPKATWEVAHKINDIQKMIITTGNNLDLF